MRRDPRAEAARLVDLGIAALDAGRRPEAASIFQKALGHDPMSLDAHMNLGVIMAHAGQQKKAVTHLQRGVSLASGHPLVLTNAAAALLEIGRWDLAQPLLEKILAKSPKDPAALTQLAFLHLENGRRDVAVDFARRATESHPRLADAHFVLYRAVYDDRNPAAALPALTRAAELDPQPWYRFLLGVLLDQTGDTEGSRKMLDGLGNEHYLGARDGWAYVKEKRTADTRIFSSTRETLLYGLEQARADGLVVELGVRYGISTRWLAEKASTVHGFDSFQGLPEEWHVLAKGAYSTHGEQPHVPANVKLHVGWFDATLPVFLKETAGPLRFANVDCDLYSSTKIGLDELAPRIGPGTVLVFDEYIVNDRWREDEYKAFQEAVTARGWKYEYLAFSLTDYQAVVRIL